MAALLLFIATPMARDVDWWLQVHDKRIETERQIHHDLHDAYEGIA